MSFRESNRRPLGAAPEWLTLGQAAKYLGVAHSTMRKWSDQGRVAAFYTPGGHRRYKRMDLDQFLDRSGHAGSARPSGRADHSDVSDRAAGRGTGRRSGRTDTPADQTESKTDAWSERS